MAESQRTFVPGEAIAGILAGLVLAVAAWVGSGEASAFLVGHLSPQQADLARRVVPAAAEVLPTPTATPQLPTDCVAPAATIAQDGFDPYAILEQHRLDVLWFYAANGWNPATQCLAIYNNWTKNGAGGSTPTTPEAYVKAQGWAPVAAVPTPAPPPDCSAPASEVARLGFDPYRILALQRPDVLTLYQANGWNPATQCVQLFDDWLRHPDGGAPTTAAAFVLTQGWATAPGSRSPSTPSPVSASATQAPSPPPGAPRAVAPTATP
jgi:hypothetical protein